MQLVSRAGWGARAYRRPNGAIPYAGRRRGVKIHYLGTHYSDRPHHRCAAYVRSLQASHMDGRGWSDIGYSFVACTHGYVYEGRGLHRRNSANGNTRLNEENYAVCALVGDSGLTEPTDEQLNGLVDAIEHCRAKGECGSWVGGHRDGYATACPGEPLYAWVRAGAPRPGGTGDTYTVKAGDTLTSIARRYATSVAELVRVNDIADPDVITVGQRLRLPAPSSPRPVVDLSRLRAAARTDPPASGTPVSYSGVRPVEDALVAEGLLERRYADGHFGTKTVAAYSLWQQRLGYRGTYPGGAADGIPGKASLGQLGDRHGFDIKE